MMIQNIKNLQCEYCGNIDITKFKDFTSKEDTYRHMKCLVCYAEITAFKES